MSSKIITKIVRFKDWAKCRIYQMVGIDTGLGFRETVGAEIEDYLTDPSWEQTFSSPNLIVFGHVKPEPNGGTRLTHPFHFKMFEKILPCIAFMLMFNFASAQEFQGEVINVDNETQTITLYDDTDKMFEIVLGPVNWAKFGKMIKECDYICGEFKERLTDESSVVHLYSVSAINKIIRPWIVYERRQ